ncbi:hypothetical protein TNCT_303981 [Trichonephila clavata]|uniref:DDE-1 domain-containing protein n=1 Tax=Trichonephila clavata TaxID=2740835 RepID=A0A8X6HFW4_TRICU|nr:hypothetical protein TNCT_303981 [Trichonephila clavata]
MYTNAPLLSNVKQKKKLSTFPSKLQPLDQGIIHDFKTFYGLAVVKSVLENLENQQNITVSNVTALIMIHKAWRAVTPLTTHNCFKKSGFPTLNLVDVQHTLMECNAEPFLWKALLVQHLTTTRRLTWTSLYGEPYLTLKV